MVTQYRTTEQEQGFNTGIAAAASEVVISGTQRVEHFNHLEVINSDAVKIEVRLDGDSTRAYFVEPKVAMVVDVSEGQKFTYVQQFNRHASTAETAALILFKAMHKVGVD